ncbi:CRISPR-associated endonuclease Cas1 1 [archaeon HR01]|nr:CRISPR-associated endonuclease Cas1 1 [archaeon HR01]
MNLVLDSFGLFLGRRRGRFVLRGREVEREIHAEDVEEIHLLNPGVGLSAAAVRLALRSRVLIVFGRRGGWPLGFITPSHLTGTVRARREQFHAYLDRRGVELVKAFASAKMMNQASLLRLVAKNRRQRDPKLSQDLFNIADEIDSLFLKMQLVDGERLEEVRVEVMNKEAEAARHYWRAVGMVIPGEFGFQGRVTRGAKDPFNMMLNYGYKAILFVEAWKSLYYAGLDPYAGFLHTDRSGRPSLALDLMEEFRQDVVDRPLLAVVGRGMLKADEALEAGEGRLSRKAVMLLTGAIYERLEKPVLIRNGRPKLKDAILQQARELVKYLLGEISTYKPYELRW